MFRFGLHVLSNVYIFIHSFVIKHIYYLGLIKTRLEELKILGQGFEDLLHLYDNSYC